MTDAGQLKEWRRIGARHSDQVLELAPRVLSKGGLGDQEWAVREQLAIAAMDLGKNTLAQEQLALLRRRFKGSPRVSLLAGLQLEAVGDEVGAKNIYENLLKTDETNVSAHQRLIALSLTHPTNAINNLLKYLDVFYTDPAAWSLLAELYADSGLYAQSLIALSHIMIIQSWDSGVVCRAGETAYTMGDYQLALKYFLRAVEMQTDPSKASAPLKDTRSWWGVKLSIKRLLADKRPRESTVPPDQATSPSQLLSLDQLATERLLDAGGASLGLRRTLLSTL